MSLNLRVFRIYCYKRKSKKILWLPTTKIAYWKHRVVSWLKWDFPLWKVGELPKKKIVEQSPEIRLVEDRAEEMPKMGEIRQITGEVKSG